MQDLRYTDTAQISHLISHPKMVTQFIPYLGQAPFGNALLTSSTRYQFYTTYNKFNSDYWPISLTQQYSFTSSLNQSYKWCKMYVFSTSEILYITCNPSLVWHLWFLCSVCDCDVAYHTKVNLAVSIRITENGTSIMYSRKSSKR